MISNNESTSSDQSNESDEGYVLKLACLIIGKCFGAPFPPKKVRIRIRMIHKRLSKIMWKEKIK